MTEAQDPHLKKAANACTQFANSINISRVLPLPVQAALGWCVCWGGGLTPHWRLLCLPGHCWDQGPGLRAGHRSPEPARHLRTPSLAQVCRLAAGGEVLFSHRLSSGCSPGSQGLGPTCGPPGSFWCHRPRPAQAGGNVDGVWAR